MFIKGGKITIGGTLGNDLFRLGLGYDNNATTTTGRRPLSFDTVKTFLKPALAGTIFAVGQQAGPEAFEYYRVANSVRSHAFELPAFREHCARMRTVFTKELIRWLPRAPQRLGAPDFRSEGLSRPSRVSPDQMT